jgi:carbamate kinase
MARVVVALGGNAIAPAGTGGTAAEQTATITRVMEPVADLIAAGWDVVLTHGNGPQVGNLLLKNELARDVVPPMPLDWCVAQTQATIGVAITTALEAALARRGLRRPVITLLSRVLVSADDPAWSAPSKPIGPYAPETEARRLAAERGQTWAPSGSRGWRRVVPSPEPIALLDRAALDLLLAAGAVVVANGGGGIPTVEEDGHLRGVEAVIDKDLAAVRLALDVAAPRLVVLTDVPGVAVHYGSPSQEWLAEADVPALRALQAEGTFAAGSMGPKVEAALRFVEASGGEAVIASIEDLRAALDGRAGTRVHRG